MRKDIQKSSGKKKVNVPTTSRAGALANKGRAIHDAKTD